MAKIISLFAKAIPLTPLMIKALKVACEKQHNNEPFGQIDIHGSFAGLLKRELIDAKTTTINGTKVVTWYVTTAGKNTLHKLGFNNQC